MKSGLKAGWVARLREDTHRYHNLVDAAYGAFDLADSVDYGRFLLAHAQATRAVEASLADCAELPRWRPRTDLLESDLVAFGLTVPPALDFQLPTGAAARWGALYVLEGSRLGGAVLLRRIPVGYPRLFLSARHIGAEWRDLLTAIEGKSERCDGWIADVQQGARACFDLYLQSAGIHSAAKLRSDPLASMHMAARGGA